MLKSIMRFFDQHLLPESSARSEGPDPAIRLAVSALLLEMTRMDGEVSPEEREAVEAAVRTSFDLSEGEAMELLALAEEERSESTDYFQFTSLINNTYTPEQKISLVEALWRIAFANEALHKYEEHLVRKVADLLHVPHSAFIAAKQRASANR